MGSVFTYVNKMRR